jgi:ribosomal 50S subunit-recycling heat shock protein
VRALAAMLVDAGGLLPRRRCRPAIAALDKADRHALHRLRVRLGALDVFVPALAQARRAALARGAARGRSGQPMPRLPAPAPRRSTAAPIRAAPRSPSAASARPGCASTSPTGSPAMPTRSARPAASDPVDHALATSLGLDETTRRLMAEVGFVPRRRAWRWRGHRRPRAAARPAPRQRLRRAGQAQALSVRIDRYLFCIRLVKSRTLAQALIEAGHVRIDGKRVEKPSEEVRVGSIIALPLRGRCASSASSPARRRGPPRGARLL